MKPADDPTMPADGPTTPVDAAEPAGDAAARPAPKAGTAATPTAEAGTAATPTPAAETARKTGSGALVEVRGVGQVRGSGAAAVTVLHDVDLSLAYRNLVVLAGRSGSGKSTLCHLIAGIMAPTSGEVLVDGRPPHRFTDWAKVSVLPQRPALDPELTVAENVFLPAGVRRRPADPDLLDRLGLTPIAGRPARETSLGEQQRTAMARALVLTPAVTVLDEPTAHQDDEHVGLVLAAITATVRAGTLAVVATHDQRVIEIADRVIPIVSGTC